MPVFVDLMKNNCNATYATWPERLYIILNGAVEFQSGPGPIYYFPNVMEKELKKILSKEN